MDLDFRKQRSILVGMAKDDPNTFLGHVSNAGLSQRELDALDYLVAAARNARGYDPQMDALRQQRPT